MFIFLILTFLTSLLALWAFHEKEVQHRDRMDSLAVNIHVNGIRGKSTVTRMLGGMLREAGKQPIVKTTGTYACVIDPQQVEHPIQRKGPANINEQYRFVKEWINGDIDSLVVECMAVRPKYQEVSQNAILRSPIVVITNVRLDHQEEMGDTLPEITASLCNTVPENGIVVTGERNPELVQIMQEKCSARGSKLIVATPSPLSQELVDKFDYLQFEENIAIVLAIADILNIPEEVAIKGMLKALPDPGTTRVTHITQADNQSFYWIPMFAINDWESTTKVYRDIVTRIIPADCIKVIALNNRSDRTDRASMFVDIVCNDLKGEFDRVVLYGDIQEAVRKKLIDGGIPNNQIVLTQDIDEHNGKELIARATQGFTEQSVAIFGLVNIHTVPVQSMERYMTALIEGTTSKAELVQP